METSRYPLRREINGKEKEIARLDLVASIDGIYRQAASHAISIVLGNVLKTFIVALFMVTLFRRLVTGRLEALAAKLQRRLTDVAKSRSACEVSVTPRGYSWVVLTTRFLPMALAR